MGTYSYFYYFFGIVPLFFDLNFLIFLLLNLIDLYLPFELLNKKLHHLQNAIKFNYMRRRCSNLCIISVFIFVCFTIFCFTILSLFITLIANICLLIYGYFPYRAKLSFSYKTSSEHLDKVLKVFSLLYLILAFFNYFSSSNI